MFVVHLLIQAQGNSEKIFQNEAFSYARQVTYLHNRGQHPIYHNCDSRGNCEFTVARRSEFQRETNCSFRKSVGTSPY